jgi:hypothetical protein
MASSRTLSYMLRLNLFPKLTVDISAHSSGDSTCEANRIQEDLVDCICEQSKIHRLDTTPEASSRFHGYVLGYLREVAL